MRRVRLARVVGAHGLDGDLRVSLQGADADCLDAVRTLWLAGADSDTGGRAHALTDVAPGTRRGECRLRLAGIGDRDAAEAARGLWLWARADDLPPPAPGEYYLHELVGCAVEDEGGGARGVVRGVWETGGADVLVIEALDGSEQLIPAASSLLREVDVAARRIVVAALPGLFPGRRLMRIDVLTIFPRLFDAFAQESMIGIAARGGQLELRVHDLRDFADGPHKSVDDAPYGGGPGMVMRPEPLVAAIEALAGAKGTQRQAHVALMSPQGAPLVQARLRALAERPHLVLVCGRYEGVDQRAVEIAVDEELSLGDYVLSGGEVPAMAIVEGVVRLLPGVLGNPDSIGADSFEAGLLEGPQYTRPAVFRGLAVPEVLRSGDHGAVARWRAERALEVTRQRRPELLGPVRGSGRDRES